MNIKTTLIIDNSYTTEAINVNANSCIDIVNLIINKPTEIIIFPYFMFQTIAYVLPFTCNYLELLRNVNRYHTLEYGMSNTYKKIYYITLNTATLTSTIKSIYKKENLLYQLQEGTDFQLIKTLLTEINIILNLKFQEWFKLNRTIDFILKEQQ